MFSLYFIFIITQKKPFTDILQIGVLKNFANYLCWSEACNFIKKRVQHGCFPVKLAKFLRTLFLQNTFRGYSCLHFLIYTYLLILVQTQLSILKFSLYYYINLIKLINIDTTTKFSRFKSISSIEDNYLEAATGGVLSKKLFLKFRNIHRKATVLESI